MKSDERKAAIDKLKSQGMLSDDAQGELYRQLLEKEKAEKKEYVKKIKDFLKSNGGRLPSFVL